MRKAGKPELARVINRQAHLLAAQSFARIRMALQDKAREMQKAGASHDETLRAIRLAGMQGEAIEP